jgi:ubiquinone/menaquinone biosynthesis C-methylase UbiE
MEFYDKVAEFYDDMTRFEERIRQEKRIVKSLVERYGLKSVVDAACGSGLHAVLLAGLGVKVVGVDISDSMLATAGKNAEASGLKIKWVHAPMQNLDKHISGGHDGLFCLGNSLPHLLTRSDLYEALKSFHNLIRPGGLLLIQLLNYDRILATKERIVGIHRTESTEYIRFYDFYDKYVHFNLLTVRRAGKGFSHSLASTPLYPYVSQELLRALTASRFTGIECYGSLELDAFDREKSQNLVIACKR